MALPLFLSGRATWEPSQEKVKVRRTKLTAKLARWGRLVTKREEKTARSRLVAKAVQEVKVVKADLAAKVVRVAKVVRAVPVVKVVREAKADVELRVDLVERLLGARKAPAENLARRSKWSARGRSTT